MYRRHFIVHEIHQLRIDEFAYKHHISKKALKDIKMKGDIFVNGEHQSVRYCLKQGDEVTFVYPSEENNIERTPISFNIIYEDDYLMVVYKPKDMACIPTRSHPTHTLANAISYYYETIGLDSTVHLVNRLDRETAGLMIVAKYREIHDLMCKDIKHIYRKYRAHVEGKVSAGTINLPIYKDGHCMKRIIDERGKPSLTHYRMISYKDDVSLVECVLETGRTHQIRIHMSALSHPLIGDTLYGGREGTFDLESVMVAFTHPVTKQVKTIKRVTR